MIKAHWPNSCHCYAHFLDLFENVANIDFSDEPFAVSSDLDLLVQKENINSKNNFSKHDLSLYQAMLQPKSFIVDHSLKLIQKYNLDKNTYGLYLRCPETFDFRFFLNGEPIPKDKCHNGKSEELISFLKWFKSQYDLHEKRIMLITDSKILCKYMLSKYKKMFTIKEDKTPNHKGNVPRRSKNSIISGLKCCFLLKSCTMLNKKQISAFSRIPNWLPEIN